MQCREHIGPFQLFLFALSVYVLGALLVEATMPVSTDTKHILEAADTAICVLFLYDFFQRLLGSKNKVEFLRWGWIDLVSSIPLLSFLRWGRFVRVVRVFRVLRAVRSTKLIVTTLFANRARGAFSTAVFAAAMLTLFTSIAILHVETDPNSNIRGASDALWWALVTMTTVGYGDKYPVTVEGRILGGILMTAGVGLFAILTGYIASWFMEKHGETPVSVEAHITGLRDEVRQLRDEIAGLKSGNHIDRKSHC